MALLDFENWGRETNLALSNWFSVSAGSVSADGEGPFGIGRYLTGSSVTPTGRYSVFPNTGDVFFELYFWYSGLAQQTILLLMDGSTAQAGLRITAAGVLELIRSTGTVVASTGVVLAQSAFNLIQGRINVHNTTGSAEIRLNKQVIYTGTNLNTRGGSNNWVNGWRVMGAGGPGRVASVLLFDGAGNAPNTWTPEAAIYSAAPTADGGVIEWTPNAGANWAATDEAPNDGDTTYVSAASSPLTDSFITASPAPLGAAPYALAVEVVARKDDAGTNELDLGLRIGATVYMKGAPAALTTTYQRFRAVWDLNPATAAAWTLADMQAAQIVIRRTA